MTSDTFDILVTVIICLALLCFTGLYAQRWSMEHEYRMKTTPSAEMDKLRIRIPKGDLLCVYPDGSFNFGSKPCHARETRQEIPVWDLQPQPNLLPSIPLEPK